MIKSFNKNFYSLSEFLREAEESNASVALDAAKKTAKLPTILNAVVPNGTYKNNNEVFFEKLENYTKLYEEFTAVKKLFAEYKELKEKFDAAEKEVVMAMESMGQNYLFYKELIYRITKSTGGRSSPITAKDFLDKIVEKLNYNEELNRKSIAFLQNLFIEMTEAANANKSILTKGAMLISSIGDSSNDDAFMSLMKHDKFKEDEFLNILKKARNVKAKGGIVDKTNYTDVEIKAWEGFQMDSDNLVTESFFESISKIFKSLWNSITNNIKDFNANIKKQKDILAEIEDIINANLY